MNIVSTNIGAGNLGILEQARTDFTDALSDVLSQCLEQCRGDISIPNCNLE
jgi:hypothetical protein